MLWGSLIEKKKASGSGTRIGTLMWEATEAVNREARIQAKFLGAPALGCPGGEKAEIAAGQGRRPRLPSRGTRTARRRWTGIGRCGQTCKRVRLRDGLARRVVLPLYR
jgi:hypothetical protein